ncbi:MAG: DUF3604 domain-containing protein [Pseudomonadota bacterium]
MPIRPLVLLLVFFVSPVNAASTRLADNLEARVPPYLSTALAQQVADLKAAVAASPTDSAEQVEARARVLWDWANAYALTGRPLHPELPSSIGRMTQGRVPPRQVDNLGTTLDWFVTELAFRDANPDGIGYLSSDHLGPFEADGFAELRQRYTVGKAPIEPGGGFLVATRMYGGPSDIQADDPAGAGYVTVTSSNPAVKFKVDSLMVSGMFSGQLGGSHPRPYFRVTEGNLQPGDVVTIVAGDRSGGGPGLKLPSQSSSALRVRVFVSLQNPAELFSLDELPFFSRGLEVAAVRGFGPSVVAVGEPALLSVRSEDEFRNRAESGFQPVDVYDNGTWIHRIENTARAYHEFEHRFTTPGVHYLTLQSVDGRFAAEFNPILVEESPQERIYWGETHGHTGFAEGAGTVDNYFRFAREDARLDFMTLSEHDLWMDDFEFEVTRQAVKHGYEPNRFLTYLGYEWTVTAAQGGHHNVIFRTADGRRRVERQRAPELGDLHRLLQAENDAADVLVIPHAHNPGRWWQSDPTIENLVEIVSNHGTFEWLGRAYLAEGYQLGFIGGSDDHIGHPGLRALSNAGSGSDNFGGMAAVIAPRLDRDLLFSAMKSRQTYATNGQKIILKTRVNGSLMGTEVKARDRTTIEGRVVGTSPISYIDLVRNGATVERLDFLNASTSPTTQLEVRFYSETDPLTRDVMSRGARPWRGSLQVSGAKLLAVETPNVENVYSEGARISADDPQRVEFFMRTRGAYRTLLLSLDKVTRGAKITLTAESRKLTVSESLGINRLPEEGHRIASADDQHEDEIVLRWVAPPTERDRSFDFVSRAAKPGENFYVRVIQANGGMAWSSPVRLN